MTAAAEPVRAGDRAWLGLAVLVLPWLQQVAQDGAGWSPLPIVAGGLAIGAVIAVGTALLAATVREHLPPAGQSGRLADAGPISAQHRSWGAIPLLRKVSCHPTQTQPKQRSVL